MSDRLRRSMQSGVVKLVNAAAIVMAAAFSFGCTLTERSRDSDALVVLLPRDAEELDPRFVGDAYGLKITRLIFASLVRIDPRTLDAVPDLAEHIEMESPTRYRVTLRDGLRFSDGSALDAEDVVATYRGLVSPTLGSRFAKTYEPFSNVRAFDRRTVVFELATRHATFLTDLEMPIVRAEDARRKIVIGKRMPIGSGPYLLAERVPGRLELRANRFWYGGKPRWPRVRMLVVRDDNTRALRMLAGAADVALNAVPPLLVPLFEGEKKFVVGSSPGIGTTYVGFNTEAGWLRDKRVRRAIAHAIDRRALIATKYNGRAQPAFGFVPSGHWAYAAGVPRYDFDQARARALLRSSGAVGDTSTHSIRPKIVLRSGSDRFVQSVARAIAAMLGEVGLDVEVRPSEVATLLADLNAGRFEMVLLQIPEVLEPHVLSWFFASDRIPVPGRAFGANRWRYRNASLDGAFARGLFETERDARREAYVEVQRTLASDLPVLPLWHEDVVAIRAANVPRFEVPRDARFGFLAF